MDAQAAGHVLNGTVTAAGAPVSGADASLTPVEGQRFEIVMGDGARIAASRTRSRELRDRAL